MMAVTPHVVLHQVTAFLDEALTQPELRHRILYAARRKLQSPNSTTLQALSLISHALDAFPSSPSPFSARPSSSSLRAAEKLLLSLSNHTPLSSLLLALACAARRRPAEAAMALFDVFILDPSSARNDLAPPVFEELFLAHLLPVIQWFADQRSRILSLDYPELAMADDDDGRSIEAAAAMSLLSRMSGGQAEELKELECGYEEVIDLNTKAYAEYLKEVLESADESRKVGDPPQLILTRVSGEEGGLEDEDEEEEGVQQFGSRNGRYNPIWAEADQSMELPSRHNSKGQENNAKAPPLFPQRVPPHVLIRQPSKESLNAATSLISDSGPAFYSDDNSEDSSSELEPDIEVKSFDTNKENNTKKASFSPNEIQYQQQEKTFTESTCSSNKQMVDSESVIAYRKQTPPKDFVCPITTHLFDDPVTLETGQTYERKAIQEWLDRGNMTCPITRQKLQSTKLPKSNYVLKRLIASWLENSPNSTPTRSESSAPNNVSGHGPLWHSPSPTSVIIQASSDGTTGDLRLAISCLCTSEVLSESEMAVLQIERFWRESSMEPEIQGALSKPAVTNGFVEILFNSVNPQVLRSTVFLLSELASRDRFVVQTLTRVDSDVECMVALFKKGLVEAAVLIYLLSPSRESLIEMDMVEALMMAIKRKEESLDLCVKPKTASILLLNQILQGDQRDVTASACALISERILASIITSLGADMVEEKIAAIGILLICMEEDGNCRNIIADKAELAPVLESFTTVGDAERFKIVCFLAELVKLNRRTFNEQLLHIIKDEGAFSTMHALLVYLQTALHDQLPIVASLLLQLDLLVEPRKMSMYREEAIDAIISCLRNSDFPTSQLLAAEAILVLQGRFSTSGCPLARAFLLKRAGMNKSYKALIRAENMNNRLGDSDENLEEENAADVWERKMAYALVSHEFGLLFEALADGLKSKNSELFSACLVSATWLSHMLSILPDTGIRGVARVCLLKKFVSILKSARDVDDKALAMLALRSFMHDPEGLHDLTLHMKDVLKSLRELKKCSVLAYEMLKLFSDGQESSIDMWNHKELVQVDCSTHGEVLSVVCFREKIFSGHTDGTIKVWSGSENLLHLIQETHEHTKAVTSLAILPSGDKLYSGSLDKYVRVWSIRGEEIQCVEVHDMKDQVNSLVVANTIACFIPQGAGVKVLSWNGGSKLLNPSKHVKSLALVQGKLYCGCHDSSIQEIDLATGTLGTVQSGNRKLLAKSNPIYALQVHEGLIYAASASSDGAAVKIWNASNYNLVGSLPSTNEVRSMTMSTELIYLGCKMGSVEIWSKDKLNKVGSLQTVTNSKVQCMDVDADGEVLVVGTSDGKLQAWGLA